MAQELETLIVLADGGRTRAFHEKKRHGELGELPAWSLSNPDPHGVSGQGGTVVGRAGRGRHNISDQRPSEASESRFLSALAARLEQGGYKHLVLIAPPKALGALRTALGPTATSRLELCDSHDRVHENAAELRRRLHRLRMPA